MPNSDEFVELALDPKFAPPPAPYLLIDPLPEEERLPAQSIQDGLESLHMHAKAFAHGVTLFWHCAGMRRKNSRDLWTEWQFVAARDGVMSAYHCMIAMEGVRSLFNRCPTWKARVNHDALRAAQKAFKHTFPFAESLRHAVAHSAEMVESPEKRSKNSVIEETVLSGGLRLAANEIALAHLDGDGVFSFTHEGRVCSYDILPESVFALNAAVGKFYDGFNALSGRIFYVLGQAD